MEEVKTMEKASDEAMDAVQIHQEKQIRQGNNIVRWLCEMRKLSQKPDFKQSGSWSYPL